MITIKQIRDKLVDLFLDEQIEYLRKGSLALGLKVDDENLENQVFSMIKSIFKQVGSDFNNPHKDDFSKILPLIEKKSRLGGSSIETIEKNRKMIEDMLSQI